VSWNWTIGTENTLEYYPVVAVYHRPVCGLYELSGGISMSSPHISILIVSAVWPLPFAGNSLKPVTCTDG